ncbi:hypothetical protein BSL78_00124 [Apostichopus japonicus]|uniref:Uncharacterized protein n=1 Tax=Stichopus japonicus TaxID=307972 RepID=A0A2G8LRL2_STIJA|nr:hypothetical protein BSL78_00124 [Apostichopus japonicus]
MSEQCFSFTIRSLNNQLPVASVLCKVWNCSVSAQCGACLASRELCNAPEQTLHHVLSSCQVSLSLKHRYTWRHNNILFALRDLYTLTLGPAWDIAIDATVATRDGNTIVYDQHTSTIPPDILPTTTCRPDLTAIDRVQRKIHIMELTCPWDSAESFNNAQERKSDRYGPLIGDLSDIGWEVDFITVEIGVRGIIAPGTLSRHVLALNLDPNDKVSTEKVVNLLEMTVLITP